MQDSYKWVTRVLLQLLFTNLLPKKTAKIYYCNIFVSVTKEDSNFSVSYSPKKIRESTNAR